MHRILDWIARFFALLGGLVLSALILMVCLSIVGRILNTLMHSDLAQSTMPAVASAVLAAGVGPINGDFELVEAGMAFAIFAFLPLCQLHGAHASVDIFTSKLPRKLDRLLRAITEAVFAAVLVLIAWQLFQGTLSKRNSGQTTFLIEYPLWWAYALCLTGATAAALVAVYVATMRVAESATGRVILPTGQGADS